MANVIDINNEERKQEKNLKQARKMLEDESRGYALKPVTLIHNIQGKKGEDKGPRNCVENTEQIFNAYDIKIRYNEMSRNIEIELPPTMGKSTDRQNVVVSTLENLLTHHSYPASKLLEHVGNIAERHAYHPMKQMIESVAWDGVDRFPDLLNAIKLTYSGEKGLADMYIKKWFVSAVAALYIDGGIKSQGILTLAGPQNIGKTSFMATLVPQDALNIGVVLNTSDKDSLLLATGKWITELGEIDATFRRSDIAHLKSFVTNHVDVIRPAYARVAERYPRRTVFYATVNKPEFLIDETGNRRFWVLSVDGFDFNHGINTQQLWAQTKVMYDNGVSYWLNQDEVELVNANNTQYDVIDPLDELVAKHFKAATMDEIDNPKNNGLKKLNATDVVVMLKLDINKGNTNGIAKALRKIGCVQKQDKVRGKVFYVWYLGGLPGERDSDYEKMKDGINAKHSNYNSRYQNGGRLALEPPFKV